MLSSKRTASGAGIDGPKESGISVKKCLLDIGDPRVVSPRGLEPPDEGRAVPRKDLNKKSKPVSRRLHSVRGYSVEFCGFKD